MCARTYTKKDVVKITAERLGYTCSETSKIVDGVFITLREMLCEDIKNLRIEIRGFGVFKVKPTKAKPKARNMVTNNFVYVPPRKKTHFKPGIIIKTAMSKDINITSICIFCGRDNTQISFNKEHIIPQNIHGSFFIDDCVCTECNSILGSQVDSELLKIPEVLDSLDKLNLKHDKEKILNLHYTIKGIAKDIELNYGKMKGTKFIFPEQIQPDGSIITPDSTYITVLEKSIKRDKRIKDAGISISDIDINIEKLKEEYKSTTPGDTLSFPNLGIAIKRRLDNLKIKIQPRRVAIIEPLIAKIAYEFLFLLGGSEFFSDDNIKIQTQLLNTIIKKKSQKGIHILRLEPLYSIPQPVHLIRIELLRYSTTVRVSFFGYIEYIMVCDRLSEKYRNNLLNALNVDDLFAIDYQQEINENKKSFWLVNSLGKVKFIGGTISKA